VVIIMIVRVKKNHFKIYILYNSVGVKEKFIIKHSFQSKNINVLIFKVHHKTSQKNLKLFFFVLRKKITHFNVSQREENSQYHTSLEFFLCNLFCNKKTSCLPQNDSESEFQFTRARYFVAKKF
jgi:hypothetical protein